METKYKTILVDPPWDYDMSRKRHAGKAIRSLPSDYYNCMTMEELFDLPVKSIADDNAHLYLWVTNAFLHEGHHLADKWGFRPVTLITWVKDKFGMGYYFRQQTEHIIFAVRGSLSVKKHNVPTFFNAKRGTHSTKPDKAYQIIEEMSHSPRVELFAREQSPLFPKRDGWDVWGNEIVSKKELVEALKLPPTNAGCHLKGETDNRA